MCVRTWDDLFLAKRLAGERENWRKRFGENKTKAEKHWKVLIESTVEGLDERDRPLRKLINDVGNRLQADFREKLTTIAVAELSAVMGAGSPVNEDDERVRRMVDDVHKLLVGEMFEHSPDLLQRAEKGESWYPWLEEAAQELVNRTANAGPLFGNWDHLNGVADVWEPVEKALGLPQHAGAYSVQDIYDKREQLAEVRVNHREWLQNASDCWPSSLRKELGLPDPPGTYSDEDVSVAQDVLKAGLGSAKRRTIIEKVLVPWPEPIKTVFAMVMDEKVAGAFHKQAWRNVCSEVEGRRRRSATAHPEEYWNQLKHSAFHQLLVLIAWRIIKNARKWHESRMPGQITWAPLVITNELPHDAEHVVKQCEPPDKVPQENTNEESPRVQYNSEVVEKVAPFIPAPGNSIDPGVETEQPTKKKADQRRQLRNAMEEMPPEYSRFMKPYLAYPTASRKERDRCEKKARELGISWGEVREKQILAEIAAKSDVEPEDVGKGIQAGTAWLKDFFSKRK